MPPLFMASNVTVPVWTVWVKNLDLNSVAPTFTVDSFAGAFVFADFFLPACVTPPPSDPAFAGRACCRGRRPKGRHRAHCRPARLSASNSPLRRFAKGTLLP
jgi:hypothetical protein